MRPTLRLVTADAERPGSGNRDLGLLIDGPSILFRADMLGQHRTQAGERVGKPVSVGHGQIERKNSDVSRAFRDTIFSQSAQKIVRNLNKTSEGPMVKNGTQAICTLLQGTA